VTQVCWIPAEQFIGALTRQDYTYVLPRGFGEQIRWQNRRIGDWFGDATGYVA
jgi:hypothetical protein